MRQVHSNKVRQQVKVIGLCIGIALFFSSYFVGSYYMAGRTYTAIPLVVEDVKLIFQKEYCLETVISFVRESVIKNSTYLFDIKTTPDQQTSTEIIDYCFESERKYLNFR